MVTQNQNYSFLEQDPLLFNSIKILVLKYYIYVGAQSKFDYKLLMRFGLSRSNVSSGPIEEGKKLFEHARYGEWRGKAFSKKTLSLTTRGGPIESADCTKVSSYELLLFVVTLFSYLSFSFFYYFMIWPKTDKVKAADCCRNQFLLDIILETLLSI